MAVKPIRGSLVRIERSCAEGIVSRPILAAAELTSATLLGLDPMGPLLRPLSRFDGKTITVWEQRCYTLPHAIVQGSITQLKSMARSFQNLLLMGVPEVETSRLAGQPGYDVAPVAAVSRILL
jgi:hypothetical protein